MLPCTVLRYVRDCLVEREWERERGGREGEIVGMRRLRREGEEERRRMNEEWGMRNEWREKEGEKGKKGERSTGRARDKTNERVVCRMNPLYP